MIVFEAIVEKSTGSWYQVRDLDGRKWKCRLAGKQRLVDRTYTNPIAVGDHIEAEIETEDTDQATIRQILPRRNFVARQSPHNRMQMHMLAANVDQAMLLVTMVQPSLKQGVIDRFLLSTEPQDIPVIIVFNKADLYDEYDLEHYEAMRTLYTGMGYEVLLVSTVTGAGINNFKEHLHNRTTLLAGQSGVGKTSLVNAVDPLLTLRTGELSDYSGKGQHTTTFAEMQLLQFGGKIIDTPGIKVLSYNNLTVNEIAHNFRDLFTLSRQCRFGASCTHRNEPLCAVKAGLETGTVNEMRYQNYLQLLDESENQKHWEQL